MLETAKTQNVSSTKIYDLLIGLGADKKKAEFAIGEFVKDIPKILASHTTEKNLDPTVPVSRGDIWRLEAIIKENKNDTEIPTRISELVIVVCPFVSWLFIIDFVTRYIPFIFFTF